MVTWKTGADTETWQRIRERATPSGLFPSALKDSKDTVVLGPAISSELGYLGQVICEKIDDSQIGWMFGIRTLPKGPPPKNVEKADGLIGGLKGIFKVLSDWRLPNVPADYRVRLRLHSRDGWRAVGIPRRAGREHKSIQNLATGAFVEQVGYRFEGGLLGLEELSLIYYHVPKYYDLNYSAKGLLKIGEGTLPSVDELSGALIRELFVHE